MKSIPNYGKVKWQIDAAPDEVKIMHALRVSPKHSGRRYGRAMVDYSISLATR